MRQQCAGTMDYGDGDEMISSDNGSEKKFCHQCTLLQSLLYKIQAIPHSESIADPGDPFDSFTQPL
jgi:hypothetical protein